MIIKPNTNIGGKQYPDMIVIHAMSEIIQGLHASNFLEKEGLSAHYLIQPYGDIVECVKPSRIGAHARGFNKNSIGIEILIEGELKYSEFLKKMKTNYLKLEQYNSLIQLCRNLIKTYDIDVFKRHSDLSPERKKDPGTGFPWTEFLNQIK